MDDAPPETLLCTPDAWPYLDSTPRHEKLKGWLKDNGIDPSDVPAKTDLKIVHQPDGPVIDHWVYLRNKAGARYVDPDNPNQAAMENRVTLCRTPPPRPRRSDITTRALLQCITDRRNLREGVSFIDSLKIPTAWDVLCEVYPDKVVAAALFRENDRDLLNYGVNVTHSFLTAEGVLRLIKLGGQP